MIQLPIIVQDAHRAHDQQRARRYDEVYVGPV